MHVQVDETGRDDAPWQVFNLDARVDAYQISVLPDRQHLFTRKRRAAPKFSCTPSGGLAKPGLGALMTSGPTSCAWASTMPLTMKE